MGNFKPNFKSIDFLYPFTDYMFHLTNQPEKNMWLI